jgi:hypothetical protein
MALPLRIIEQQVWTREPENLGIGKKCCQRETQQKVRILSNLGRTILPAGYVWGVAIIYFASKLSTY